MTRFVAWYPSIAADPKRSWAMPDDQIRRTIDTYYAIEIGESDGPMEAMPNFADTEALRHFEYMGFNACAEGATEEEARENAFKAAQAERLFIEISK